MSSQLQTVQEAASTGRYSKRKRVQINYYEDISDIEDIEAENESQDAEDYSQAKVH